MELDGSEHDLLAGLAARRSVRLELVPEPVLICRKALDVAWQRPESLLHSSLVGATRVVLVMALELLSQLNSYVKELMLIVNPFSYFV